MIEYRDGDGDVEPNMVPNRKLEEIIMKGKKDLVLHNPAPFPFQPNKMKMENEKGTPNPAPVGDSKQL